MYFTILILLVFVKHQCTSMTGFNDNQGYLLFSLLQVLEGKSGFHKINKYRVEIKC